MKTDSSNGEDRGLQESKGAAGRGSGGRLHVGMVGLRGIPHTYGGGEEFVRHLAPRLVERGIDVTVYCRRGLFTDLSPRWEGVRRVFLPTVEHKWLGQLIHGFLATAWAASETDVVYVHTLPSAPFIPLPRLLGRAVVVNVNGLDWERAKWGPVARRYFMIARTIALGAATRIVNDSKVLQRYYLDRWGADSEFIAYGADIELSPDADLLQPYNLKPDGYYLIASRLVPENNAEMIINAFLRANSSRVLVVAGAANYDSPWLNELTRRAGDRVRFLGHVADPKTVVQLHLNCFAYIHGHTMGGTNPSLLKALGCGNCIVAYSGAYNREVLTSDDGWVHAELFDDETELVDAIHRLEGSSWRVNELRSRARDRVSEAYTWDSIADRYETLFRNLGGLANDPRQ